MMHIRRLACAGTLLISAVLFFPAEILAQQLSLSGTVRDTSGVVPGATVVLNSGGNQVSTATTDQTGVYRFNGLAAGAYELSFVMRGFETVVRNVTLGPDTPPMDVLLSVGRVSTTLTVTASAGKATATRLPVADDDVPVQVSSIPQELLRQQGTNTVADALKNASGVQAVRWYGVYEQYTIRGFFDPDRDGFNAVLVDGMRMGGNRYGTQTNNIQSVEVLKGPSSVIYGRGAVGGAINLVRKKPEALRAYDVSYRGGRFNTHQVAVGATGPVGDTTKFLYRLDASYENSDGWRNAGAARLNVSPSLTWLMNENARLTIHQIFNRDRFDGDGGVPINITDLPSYKPELRFSLPQDNALVEDSQTQVVFSGSFSSAWQFRNAFHGQRTSDRYFVTEGVYGDPDDNLVYREPLDFHHIRRPVQNQAEVLGNIDGFGRHNLLFGYEYQRDKYRTEVTAGDDPDCLCGYWWLTIAPMDITTLEETQPPLDIDAIERQTFVNEQIQAFYWQDQIDVLPQLKINVGGRFDDYKRRISRIGGLPFTPVARDQSAYSYRAGLVYAPRNDHQLYFSTASSFTPVTTVPADGSQLDPSTARNYEVGHRWQGWNGRVDTSLAGYYTVRNNLNIRQSVTTLIQIGEQTSKGLDLDVNTDLGGQTHLILNYGFARPRFADAEDLTGRTPRFVPRHNTNVWLRKDWASGFNASIGARYLGAQFVDNANSVQIDGYTIVSGAVGYRADRWEWLLNADNLFNKERYFLPGHFSNLVFPGQPINVTSTIRLRFN
jgi:iron complex outermembrane receptor protein